jgi:hypothetical protein
MVAGGYYHIPAESGASFIQLALQDTSVRGGILHLIPGNPSQIFGLTNCLFEQVTFKYLPYAAATLHARNNLFKQGSLTLEDAPALNYNNVTWQDNLFDGAIISQLGNAAANNDYNAYVHAGGNTTRLTPAPSPSHDQILTASPAYDVGPFGKYYLPATATQLIDQGSVTDAKDAGLFHYTTSPKTSELGKGE